MRAKAKKTSKKKEQVINNEPSKRIFAFGSASDFDRCEWVLSSINCECRSSAVRDKFIDLWISKELLNVVQGEGDQN